MSYGAPGLNVSREGKAFPALLERSMKKIKNFLHTLNDVDGEVFSNEVEQCLGT